MYYFEYLRLRKGLIVFTAIAGAIVLFQMLSLPFSHVSGNGDNNFGINIGGGNVDVHAVSGFALVRKFAQSIHVPFALVCAIAGLLAVIFGTSAATSLNRQNAHAHFEFTKPVSRVRLALTTIGCDLAAIGIAFAVTVVLILIPFAVIGIVDRIRFDTSALFVTAFAFGIAYMWYGMMQVITVRIPGRAGTVVGISWAVFAVLSGLSQLRESNVGWPVVDLIRALNTFNPFVYLPTLFFDATGQPTGFLGGSFERLATAWAIALVTLACAVVLRKRMET